MNHLDADDLPPELDEIAGRMRDERPVVSDQALHRAMTRGPAPRRRGLNLLWSSRAPRVPKLSLAFGAAAIIAVAGIVGLGATALTDASGDAALVAYTTCASGDSSIVHIDGTLLTDPLDIIANIRLLEGDIPNTAEIVVLSVTVDSVLPPVIAVEFCVNL